MSPRNPSLEAKYPPGKAPRGGRLIDIGRWGGRDHISLADQTIARLRELGITTPGTNRLEAARKWLERAALFDIRPGRSDPSMEKVLCEATRMVLEMRFIVETLASRGDQVRPQLRKMLGGPDEPREGRHDPARDMQAELLTVSALSKGGYEVALAEPDLILTADGPARAGVAVKRSVSDKQIKKRLREARDQLARSKVRGFVVINAERYLARLYFARRHADLGAELYRRVVEWHEYLERRDPDYWVQAVIGMATTVRVDPLDRSFICRFHFVPHFLVLTQPAAEALAPQVEQMAERMFSGLQAVLPAGVAA